MALEEPVVTGAARRWSFAARRPSWCSSWPRGGLTRRRALAVALTAASGVGVAAIATPARDAARDDRGGRASRLSVSVRTEERHDLAVCERGDCAPGAPAPLRRQVQRTRTVTLVWWSREPAAAADAGAQDATVRDATVGDGVARDASGDAGAR